MKKRFSLAKFAFISVFSLGFVSLVACGSEGHVIQSDEKNIVSITVKEGSIPEEIFIGHFDEAGITLVVRYSDGSSEEVKVTTQMIPEKYREYLTKEGEYEIAFIFRGETVHIHINIVKAHYLVNFYAYTDAPEYTLVDTQDILINEDAYAPTIEQDIYYEGMHYSFTSWDDVFTNITEPKNIYAQYSSIEYYTVNFYNGNNELIDSQKVDKGDDAIEPDETLRNMPGYEFVGWDRNYSNVTSDLDIYGLYVSVTTETTSIVFASNYNDVYQDIINRAAQSVMEKYDNINITCKKVQGSYLDAKEQVIDGVADGTYPDIVAAYPDDIIDFFNAGIALDITDQINNASYGLTQADKADFYQFFLESGTKYPAKGTYSMPLGNSTDAMYYNQDVLIGLNLSEIDSTINNGSPLTDEYIQNLTWEELFDKLIPALDMYDQSLGGSKIIDRYTYNDWAWVGYDSDENFFITLAEQYGYGYVDVDETTGETQLLFNNDNMKALINKFKGYCNNHYFTTKEILKTNVNYRFNVDSMLFSIGSTGGVKYQFSSSNQHNIGVAPIPHPEGKQLKSPSQGPSIAFLNHHDSQRAKASWLFYKELTSTRFNTLWSLATSYSPLRKSVGNDEEFKYAADYTNFGEKTLERLFALNATFQLENNNYLYQTPVFSGSGVVRSSVGKIFVDTVGINNVEQAFSTAYLTALDAIDPSYSGTGLSILNKDYLQNAILGKRKMINIGANPFINIVSAANNGTLRVKSSNETVVKPVGLFLFYVGTGQARITVSYEGISDFVDLSVINLTPKMKYGTVHEGTLEDPFDNADACKVGHLIKDSGETTTSETDLYIKGKVASFYHYPGTRADGAVSWFLEPATEGGEQFEIYRAYKDGGAGQQIAITEDEIWAGAIVTVHGPITFYNNQMETSYAWLDKVEGEKPELPQTINATVSEAIAVGTALEDGDSTYDYYKITGYAVKKSGNNYFLADTQTVAEDTQDKALLELYKITSAEDQAKLLKGAKVTVKMRIKNYHGQIENGNVPEITVIEAGQPWTIN